MKSLLFRTGSGRMPVQPPLMNSSPRISASAGVLSGESNAASSPRISLHMEVTRRNIRRSSSESDLIRSEIKTLSNLRSLSFQSPIIPEYSEINEDRTSPAIGTLTEELGLPGGGMNDNRSSGGGGGNWNDANRNKIGAYYEEILKSDSKNALILRNYAKYLHEVEGDLVKAEEYYSRAILASPGDGEVLSLYGKLIWESHRDESRAKSYFDQALHVSPNDCTVLGSYAHFLWEADEEEEEVEANEEVVVSSIAAMVEAC